MAGEHGVTPERYEQPGRTVPLQSADLAKLHLNYVGGVLTGDFGVSISSKRPVIEDFDAVPCNGRAVAACHHLRDTDRRPGRHLAAVSGSWSDQSLMGIALVGYSMPIFWWGLLLIIFFSGYLGWTPVSGRIGLQFFLKPITGFMTIDSLLYGKWTPSARRAQPSGPPTIVLGTIPLAVIARQTRLAMLEVLGEDYVRTAPRQGPGRRAA